jgi:hypothetical protein
MSFILACKSLLGIFIYDFVLHNPLVVNWNNSFSLKGLMHSCFALYFWLASETFPCCLDWLLLFGTSLKFVECTTRVPFGRSLEFIKRRARHLSLCCLESCILRLLEILFNEFIHFMTIECCKMKVISNLAVERKNFKSKNFFELSFQLGEVNFFAIYIVLDSSFNLSLKVSDCSFAVLVMNGQK